MKTRKNDREKCLNCEGMGHFPWDVCEVCLGTGGVPSAPRGLHPWIKDNRRRTSCMFITKS